MARKYFHNLKCPSCSALNTLRNSRVRNTKERLIQFVTIFRVYRCKKCSWRGWKANLSLKKESLQKVAIYFFLMLMAAFIVYNLLKLVV